MILEIKITPLLKCQLDQPECRRLYSKIIDKVSTTDAALADSGTVTDSYTNVVWAEANRSTSYNVNSAIVTFTAYQSR